MIILLNRRPAIIFLLKVCCALLFVSGNSVSLAQAPKSYLVTQYGAIGDSTILNTNALQEVINLAHREGGGQVVIPSGRFVTGSLVMKTGVDLYLSEGAQLLGSVNPSHYTRLAMPGRPVSPKQDDNSQLALLLAYRADNISITGPGTIDGRGRALALAIDSLHHAGVVVDPNYSTWSNRPSETVRPKLVRFSTCNDVRFAEATFKNSASWGLSFELCNRLTLDSLVIINRAYWNNDGMDITDCRNVRITNCNVNAADDGICLKSYYPGHANNGVYIAHNTICSGASAIKFGTASYGDFRNVVIDSNRVYDTFRSAIALESVDGGTIENINITHLVAENTGNAVFLRIGHRDGSAPGKIRNVRIQDAKIIIPFERPDLMYDIRAHEPGYHNPFPSSITGLDGAYVENVVFKNVEITYPGRASRGQAYLPLSRLADVPEKAKDYPEFSMFGELPAWGFYVRHARGIRFHNVTLRISDPDFRPAIVFDDVQGIELNGVRISGDTPSPSIIARQSVVILGNAAPAVQVVD